MELSRGTLGIEKIDFERRSAFPSSHPLLCNRMTFKRVERAPSRVFPPILVYLPFIASVRMRGDASHFRLLGTHGYLGRLSPLALLLVRLHASGVCARGGCNCFRLHVTKAWGKRQTQPQPLEELTWTSAGNEQSHTFGSRTWDPRKREARVSRLADGTMLSLGKQASVVGLVFFGTITSMCVRGRNGGVRKKRRKWN